MKRLEAGDILIFKVKSDEWISKAIAYLTDTDVSHAAMILLDNRMVEMAANGIDVNQVEVHNGDEALLLRLCKKQDPTPLLNAAKKYMDCKTRYDFPALAILAGLIIYRKVRPTPKFVAITDLLLRSACAAVDKLIQAVILKKPGKAMVCSQLVYQIYEDCGEKYRIIIQGGLLQETRAPLNMDGRIRLVDLMREPMDWNDVLSDPVPRLKALDEKALGEGALDGETLDGEALAKELYEALVQQDESGKTQARAIDLMSLPSLTRSFLDMLEKLLEECQSELPINALFITPGDIAYKSLNLKTEGSLNIVRHK